MPQQLAIQTSGLSKRYKGVPDFALKDLSIRIMPGEIYGFLGSNGTGKSTTIRTMLGFLSPTNGSANILGLDTVRDSTAIKQHVGYLAGDVALYLKMTGSDLLRYLQELQPIKHSDYFTKLVVDFDADLSKPIGQLSKGNRQKIGIIQALMHEPEVLILDEPTSGLDPLMQEVFAGYIKQAKSAGAAVFLSSHNLAEVQEICDRVGIIRKGILVKEQQVDDLGKGTSQRFTVTFADKAPTALNSVPGVVVINANDNKVVLQVKNDLQPLLSYLSTKHVTRLTSLQESLEEEFLQFYEGEKQ
jgi:ABC-2 type transport system ATP-binding protein